jgi:hypothetical protein
LDWPKDRFQETKELYRDLLQRYTRGLGKWQAEWGTDGEGKKRRNNRNPDLLAYLRQQHDYTTCWLTKLFEEARTESEKDGDSAECFTYRHLLGAHLSQATGAHLRAQKNIADNQKRTWYESINVPGRMAMDLFETFQVYVDNADKITDYVLLHTSYRKEEMVRLAWWMMMYRGLCWYLSVSLVGPMDRSSDGRGGMIIPSSLWDSQVSVYIV